jgi:hypothetical protein
MEPNHPAPRERIASSYWFIVGGGVMFGVILYLVSLVILNRILGLGSS